MKRIPLAEAKDTLSAVIRAAQTEAVVITRHGRPAAIVIGFKDEDDWLEYRLLHDEAFLNSIAQARADIGEGRFTRLEDLLD
jgi:prevent-host-death family protein